MTDESAYRGAVFVAVILVPGIFCIGAYLVKPVCWRYGIAYGPAPAPCCSSCLWSCLSSTCTFTGLGPLVPEMLARSGSIAAGNVPAILLSVNRSENTVIVPELEVAIIPMKLWYTFSRWIIISRGNTNLTMHSLEMSPQHSRVPSQISSHFRQRTPRSNPLTEKACYWTL